MNAIFDSLLDINKDIIKNNIKSIDELFSEFLLSKIPKKVRKTIESRIIEFDFENEQLTKSIELYIFSCYHLSFKSLKVLVTNDLLSEDTINKLSEEDIMKLRGVGNKTVDEIIAFKQIINNKTEFSEEEKNKSLLSPYFSEGTINELNRLNIIEIEELQNMNDFSNINNKDKEVIRNLIEINLENDDIEIFDLYDTWKKMKSYTLGEILSVDKEKLDSLKFNINNSFSHTFDYDKLKIKGKFLELILTNKLNDITNVYLLTYEQFKNQLNFTKSIESKIKNLIINNIVVIKEDRVIFASPSNYIYSNYHNFVLKTTNEKDNLNILKNIGSLIERFTRKGFTIKSLKMMMLQNDFIEGMKNINKSEAHAVEIFTNIYYRNRHETFDVIKEQYLNIVSNIPFEIVINYFEEREIFTINDYGRVIISKQKLKNFIKFIENERYQKILIERLSGKTLEEASIKADITRERVRQIIDKILQNMDEELVEDRYRIIFEEYSFTQEEFVKIFDVDSSEYYYLLNKYDKGEKEISNFINEDRFGIDNNILERIISYKNRDYIILGNDKIKKRKYEILEYLLRIFCNELTNIEDLYDVYHEFINEYNLSESLKVDKMASFESTMERSEYCIIYPNKRVKYYPFDKYCWSKFYQELSIDSFMDKEISTLVLFENQKELMIEYDINDHFELHNIIRRTHEGFNLPIAMGRNPHIRIGNDDIDYQILELLIELAPISQADFVSNFSERYGIRQDTLLANTYLDVIEEYLQNGVYHINNDYLSKIDLDYLRIKLEAQDFHFIDEIKKDYLNHAGSELLATEYVFKQLGFKMGSSYIYSEQYGSFIEYMKRTIFNKDIVNITQLPYRMKNLSTFRAYTQKLVENHEFIEFEFEKYISLNRLSQNGMTNEVIDKYIDKLVGQLEEDKIYDFQKILENSEDNVFNEFGFGLRFYESMFRRDKDRRRIHSLSVGGTLLIRKYQRINSLTDLLQQIIDEYRSFNIYDLIYYLNEEYNVVKDRSFILERVKECDMYFNEIMEKIYIDNDYYYEELG